MFVGKRNLLVVLTIITAMAIGGASAVLANGNSGNVIYACVNNNSGEVKIVAADTVCHANSTLVHWNQEGTPGMDGADGMDGTNGMNGTDGTDGAPGISGYEQVVQTEMLVDAQVGDFITAGVACPDGKKVLGGGAQGFIHAVVVSSSPRTGDDSKWDTIFRVTEASSLVTVSAHAICGFVAS
jgi:hypothetical protein